MCGLAVMLGKKARRRGGHGGVWLGMGDEKGFGGILGNGGGGGKVD
jgi:hypothetical protein